MNILIDIIILIAIGLFFFGFIKLLVWDTNRTSDKEIEKQDNIDI